MLYNEIIAVCSQIHTKHINILCGQNVEYLYVKAGGTYSDHWFIKGVINLETFTLYVVGNTSSNFVLRMAFKSLCYGKWILKLIHLASSCLRSR
jgi:hypothetical protein